MSSRPETDAPVPPGAIPRDERLGTLIFSGVMLVLGVFWTIASINLPLRSTTYPLDQRFLPGAAGVMLALFAAGLLIQYWRKPSAPDERFGKERLFEPRQQVIAAGVYGLLLGYILLLPHVHYIASTFLLSLIGLRVAGQPLGLKTFLQAAGMSVAFFVIFVWGLDVALPGSRYF